MRDGREVVEDYGSTGLDHGKDWCLCRTRHKPGSLPSSGLSVRRHPVAFLRDDLRRRGMAACDDLAHLRDGRRVAVPGLVLGHQALQLAA